MDRWNEIEVFTRIAELGSISKAADAVGMSVSATSRHLIALEERLKVRLIQRTTRNLYLTIEGERFFEQSKSFLQKMKDAEAHVSDLVLNPSGKLRISTSPPFCLMYLNPIIASFRKEYPDVTFDVVACSQHQNLTKSGVDIAIRARRYESDSSITIRRLSKIECILAASPDYLAGHGTPIHPDDLGDHDFILHTVSDDWNQFSFQRGSDVVSVSVDGVINSNDGQIIVKAALDGLGILALPTYELVEHIAAGSLVRVLADWDLPHLTMNIAYQTKVHLPARTRVFIDYFLKSFRDRQYGSQWMR